MDNTKSHCTVTRSASKGIVRRLFTLCVFFVSISIFGCYGPFGEDTEDTSSMTLDLSGVVGALDVPTDSGWVIDVWLFDAKFVTRSESSLVISSRSDSVSFDGNRYYRIVVGGTGGYFGFGGSSEATAIVPGIPAGGPYYLLIQLWANSSPEYYWRTVGSTVMNELSSFSIRRGEITSLDGNDISILPNFNIYEIFFQDTAEQIDQGV